MSRTPTQVADHVVIHHVVSPALRATIFPLAMVGPKVFNVMLKYVIRRGCLRRRCGTAPLGFRGPYACIGEAASIVHLAKRSSGHYVSRSALSLELMSRIAASGYDSIRLYKVNHTYSISSSPIEGVAAEAFMQQQLGIPCPLHVKWRPRRLDRGIGAVVENTSVGLITGPTPIRLKCGSSVRPCHLSTVPILLCSQNHPGLTRFESQFTQSTNVGSDESE